MLIRYLKLILFLISYIEVFSLDFDKSFSFSTRIKLKRAFNIVDIAFDKNSNMFIVDSGEKNIKKYSSKGELLKVIGKEGSGPGEFIYPRCIWITSADELCVGDSMARRVNFFTLEGKFIKSLICKGISYLAKGVDLNNRLLVSGLKHGDLFPGYFLHFYTKEGNPEKSFFPLEHEIVNVDALFTLAIYAPFDIDSYGNIYTSWIYKYKIHKFSPVGELIKIFPTPKTYIPPSKPFPNPVNRGDFEKWESKWHQVLEVFAVKDYILVSLKVHTPKEFRIDIYNKEGDLIKENILTDLELLGKDSFENLYFKGKIGEDWSEIEIYKLKL